MTTVRFTSTDGSQVTVDELRATAPVLFDVWAHVDAASVADRDVDRAYLARALVDPDGAWDRAARALDQAGMGFRAGCLRAHSHVGQTVWVLEQVRLEPGQGSRPYREALSAVRAVGHVHGYTPWPG